MVMNHIKYLNTLIVRFNNEIKYHEIPLFRGAVIASMDTSPDILFHNHLGDEKLRYSYPLIQYKRIGGKAAIVCIGDGTNIIGQFLSGCNAKLKLGEREMELEVNTLQPRRILLQTWEDTFTYHLKRWIPLNAENYQRYMNTESAVERITILERIIKGNILSMCKGLGITIEKEIAVTLTDVSYPYKVKNKGVALLAFDVVFKTNVSIPDYVGLGKNASIGFGVVCRKRKKNNDNNNAI